jgi:phosphate transport system substrate-binding protein
MLLLGACEGDPAPPRRFVPTAVVPPEDGVLRLMGTGAMTALARRLVEAWTRSPEGSTWRVVVEPSVGSGGGVRAAWDGVVDLGMISRLLNEREQGLGLRVFSVARGGVVLAVQRDTPLRGVSGEEIERLYRGEGSSDGRVLSLLLRDREESANGALERWFPSLKLLREQAYQQRRARVLYHDEAMREALVATPGAVGVVDFGAVLGEHSALRGLAIDGVEPTLDTMRNGRWKATRELSFVFRPERAERVQAFLRFVRSREARTIIETSGCVVVEGEP